jgi:hypothetical protein
MRGCPDGHYRLGQVEFDVTGGVARRADGTLSYAPSCTAVSRLMTEGGSDGCF